MEGKDVSKTLPEEVVEKIFAMVPYPHIFKARVLSKSWLDRLSPISSHGDDEQKKRLAHAFQKRVGEYSTKWPTFCPVNLCKEHILAYDGESLCWRNMPGLYSLPEELLEECTRLRVQLRRAERMLRTALLPSVVENLFKEFAVPQIRGALMLVRTQQKGLFVANVLTRTWKNLRPAPREANMFYFTPNLVNYMETYKVIELSTAARDAGGRYYLAAIYDALSESWSSKRIDLSVNLEFDRFRGEYLDGVLYWVGGVGWEMTGTCLLTFNVKEESFEVLQIAPTDIPFRRDLIAVLVCGGSLLMVVYGVKWGDLQNVIVVRMDLGSRRWVQVTRGPPHALKYGWFNNLPVSDGSCIFFSGDDLDIVLAYNVRTDGWSSFPVPFNVGDGSNGTMFASHAIQLGLNPFVAV